MRPSQNKARFHLPAFLSSIFLLSMLVGSSAMAATTVRVDTDQQRRGEDSRRPAVSPPPSTLPEELRQELAATARNSAGQQDRVTNRRSATVERQDRRGDKPGDRGAASRGTAVAPRVGDPAIRRAARQAAHRTVGNWAEPIGRRELYRLGFGRGSRQALDDSRLGRWDLRQGRRHGASDPQARTTGSELGGQAAKERARAAAQAQVASQFRDLTREPRLASTAGAPSPWHSPELAVPQFEEALHKVPLRDFWHGDSGSRPRARELLRKSGWRSYYSNDWCDPQRAWKHWRRRGEKPAMWNRLDEDGQSRFAEIFRRAFSAEIGLRATEFSTPAYEHGFDDGWGWGAQVSYEWGYRRGYHEGFSNTHREAAESTYRETYVRIWRSHYRAEFDRWSRNPQLEIVAVDLVDGNDDGVFEPGEEVLASWQLVNFGGAEAELSVSLEGRSLVAGDLHLVRLPRRRATSGRRPLAVVIEPSARPRSTVRLSFHAGDLTEKLELPVAYPLQLERSVTLGAHDSLEGWAEILAEVVNISRRAVPANFELLGARGRLVPARQAPEQIEPGERQQLVFRVDGIHPLDLLAGELQVSLVARAGGFEHDRSAFRLPELAADLDNRDLLRYLERLARVSDADRGDVERAQALMLRRLEADWRAAVRADGNPYREDFRAGSRRTALGDLVATAAAIKADDQGVFAGLATRIDRLTGELPGSHPMLRRWARKLVRRMG